MKNSKKNITKLKYIRVNSDFKNETEIDETQSPNLDISTHTKSDNENNNLGTFSKPTYKKFEDKKESKTSETPKQGFKLPKFLAQREEAKAKINSAKNTLEQTKNAGNLPFTPENFGKNPNSFTSIFQKDHAKINGIQRVFRKSMLFLILQLISFVLISLATIGFLGFEFESTKSFLISFGILNLVIVVYTVVTSIFYIIVADRSYIWISLLFQGLSLVLLFSFIGMGFGYPTIILTLLISILGYFAYLEIEKVQVSTRFFSIGYITSEAIKILSTIAILVISLGVFNTVMSQTPQIFVTNKLIQNDFVFSNLVANNSRFSLNSMFQVKGDYNFAKDKIDTSSQESQNQKNQTIKDFLNKNYDLDSQTTKNLAAISGSCPPQENGCKPQLSQIEDEFYTGILQKISQEGKLSNLKISDKLNYENYKQLLKGFYADKIADFETQKTTQTIPFLSSIQPLIESGRIYFIPATLAIVMYVILLVAKFLVHILSNILIWIIWKILVALGFVKIEVELVESEIVSI